MKLSREALDRRKQQLKIEDIHLKAGFQGNLKLKRPGEKFEWTPEQQEEYIRCSQDPVYFVEQYMKVVHVDHGLVSMKLYDYQREMLLSMSNNRNTIITTARQIGKALPLDTEILTPSGYTTIKDIHPGDVVFGRDGKKTTVTAVSPVFTNRQVFEITFDNGIKMQADGEHLWNVNTTSAPNKTETKTTSEIFGDFIDKAEAYNWYTLPLVEPIEYESTSQLPVRPYTVGTQLVSHPTGGIPHEYMVADVNDRFRVVHGLINTVGKIRFGTATISLSNTHGQLIDDVYQLVVGLGFKIFTKTDPHTTTFSFSVRNNKYFVHESIDGLRDYQQVDDNCLVIRNIERVTSVPTKCISVDNDDHLFLCTKHLIPTHNSTVTCAYITWYVIFHSDKTVALLANKGQTAREIMNKIHIAYQNLPKWIQQGVIAANKGSLELENGSRVIAEATSGSAIRGYSINLLFIDEAAFIENWEEFFTSVAPTISSGKTTKMILVSTPNGLNHYHKLWVNANAKRTDYHPIQVTWRQVPGRDEEWRKKTLADLNFDQDKFAQENECVFIGSSGTLITGRVLSALVHQEPIQQHDGLRQYVSPISDHQYTMVADVSKGVGLDHQAFSIIDVSKMPYIQVCTYYNNNTLPGDFAEIVHNMAKIYNNATVLIEINNPAGESVSTLLIDTYEYDGVLFTENAGRAGKRISMGMGTRSGVDKGINTNVAVKAKGCSLLKALVEQQQLIINDHHTISELSTFSRKGKSYEAESGNHDDLVMTLVLFAWLTDNQFFKELTDINTLQKLRVEESDDIENVMVKFGLRLTGVEEMIDGAVDSTSFDQLMMTDRNDLSLEAAFNNIFTSFSK